MTLKSTDNFFSFTERADLIAIINSDKSISYKDLFTQAKQIAFALSNKGIKKDNYISLLIEDNFLFIKTVIAIWFLGSIPVPLNTKLLDDEINSILYDHDFKLLVTDKEPSPNLDKKDFGVIDLTKIIVANSEVKSFSFPSLGNEAVIIFTSGSSGSPKAVVHTFSSLVNNIENGSEILNPKENNRWLASLPFYHIGGFQIICRSLFYGCSIILPESLQINDLAKSITEFIPTHLSLVSTQLERLINQKVKPCIELQVSLIGGGLVDDELMFEADELGWKPNRVYGSSETASMVTAISANEIKDKPQSVGKPFKNVEIKISDDSEILIKSNSLFKRYLGDEKETASKLKDEFFHTGDLGFVDDDGYLFIEARRNDLIVSGGENVNPIEVEKALIQIPFIKDACVFPKQDKTWGQIVAAAIVIAESSVEEKTIKEMLKQKLAGYKIPKQFYFVDHLPHTSLGKLKREKIKKCFSNSLLFG